MALAFGRGRARRRSARKREAEGRADDDLLAVGLARVDLDHVGGSGAAAGRPGTARSCRAARPPRCARPCASRRATRCRSGTCSSSSRCRGSRRPRKGRAARGRGAATARNISPMARSSSLTMSSVWRTLPEGQGQRDHRRPTWRRPGRRRRHGAERGRTRRGGMPSMRLAAVQAGDYTTRAVSPRGARARSGRRGPATDDDERGPEQRRVALRPRRRRGGHRATATGAERTGSVARAAYRAGSPAVRARS